MEARYYKYSPSCPQEAFGCFLVYSNQMEFKSWARRQGLSKKNGADYYFDYITPVDARDSIERCKKMVSEDPSYWTLPKLIEFEKVEKRLYQDWWDGNVYGYIIEKWDEKRREWAKVSSCYGMYGAEELMMNLAEDADGVSIPICIDDEDMKYDFDNTERKVNEFDGSTPG